MRPYSSAILLTALSLLVHSCQKHENELDIRDNLFFKTLSNMKAEIKNSYDVRFLSSGGSTLGGVRNFSFSFEVSKPISINEARMLAVSSIEIALRTINSCAEIRPYLVEYPFPPSKLNIGLSIPPNNDIADSLRNIFFSHGRLSYFSHDEKCQIVLMFEEPLEDALDKIRKEQSLNINSFFEENL